MLQRYAHATFEPDNQQLIGQLGWDTEYFVPPAEGAEAASDAGLEELNVLWKSTASAAERQLLFKALQQLLAAPKSSPDTAGARRRGGAAVCRTFFGPAHESAMSWIGAG